MQKTWDLLTIELANNQQSCVFIPARKLMITLPLCPKARIAALVHTINVSGVMGPIPGAIGTFVSPFQRVLSFGHRNAYVCLVSGSYRTLYSWKTYHCGTDVRSSGRKDWYHVAPQDPRRFYSGGPDLREVEMAWHTLPFSTFS